MNTTTLTTSVRRTREQVRAAFKEAMRQKKQRMEQNMERMEQLEQQGFFNQAPAV